MFKGRTLVSARLGQDFKNLAFIVYGALQICSLATNSDKDLVKMPVSEGRTLRDLMLAAIAGPDFKIRRRIVS